MSASSDVDAYAGRVTKAGGAVHVPPTDIPNIGRFAMVADPQGAVFSLFKPLSDMPPPPADPATPGTIGWHELMAGQRREGLRFLCRSVRLDQGRGARHGGDGPIPALRRRRPAIGGMMTKPAEVPAPFWGYYFRVDAIGAALERLKKEGGQVINGPMEVPGGDWIVQGIDPQGAMFSLVSRKA